MEQKTDLMMEPDEAECICNEDCDNCPFSAGEHREDKP